jgi:hypothetical protein
MPIKINKFKIDMEKSFKSISIPIPAIQRLAKNGKNRVLLERYGINPCNFDPVVAAEIDMEQWVRILLFYAKECRYKPAKDILADLKKIIIGNI